ncbi:MAG: tetratricopeptide repeat protein, partial [Candidatus Acidiferrales bacterium]
IVLGLAVLITWGFVKALRRSNKTTNKKWGDFLKRSVIVFIASVLVLGVFACWIYRYVLIPSRFKAGEIGIIVTEVPGDDSDQTQQKAYINAIRDWAADHPSPVQQILKVNALQRPLPPDPEAEQSEAIKIGRWTHATFVLRPEAVVGTQEPRLTVVDRPEFSRNELHLDKFQTSVLSNLDESALPKTVALLAESTLGYSLYTKREYEQCISIFRDILAAQDFPQGAPSRASLDFFLGNSLLKGIQDYDEAISAYNSALQVNHGLAEAVNNKGVALTRKGMRITALDVFEHAIQMNPGLIEARLNYADALGEVHNSEEAIGQYELLLHSSPADPRIYFGLGNAYFNLNKFQNAELEYETAIRFDSSCTSAFEGSPDRRCAREYNNLGNTLASLGKNEKSVEANRVAVSMEPGNATFHNNLCVGLGDTGKNDDLAEAVTECQRAVELSPGEWCFHDDLCNAYRMNHQLINALNECDKAIRLNQTAAVPHYNKAMVLQQCGEMECGESDVIKEYKSALRLNPNYALAHAGLGVFLASNGKQKEGIIELKKALSLGPQNAWIRDQYNRFVPNR